MIEQDNNGMKTPWTELELGNSCYSSYIVEPIFVPKETAFWLCRPDAHERLHASPSPSSHNVAQTSGRTTRCWAPLT